MMKRVTSIIIILAWANVPPIHSQDLSNLFEKLSPSVVVIKTLEGEGSLYDREVRQGLGSGVILEDGLVLTASHVVHKANLIKVITQTGEEISAEVVTSVPAADLALLKLKRLPANFTATVLGNSDEVKVGQEILVIGAPLGLGYSLSSGHISGRHVRPLLAGGAAQLELLQTDAAINQGNSGGPMFDMNGKVIGIISFILSNDGTFSGLGFAVSSNTVKEILLESPSIWSGFEGLYLDEETAAIFNVPQRSGILVQRVVKGSLVDQMGLRSGKYKAKIAGRDIWIGGDVILEIQGTSCEAPHSFSKIKKELQLRDPEQAFTMRILRAGEIIELEE